MAHRLRNRWSLRIANIAFVLLLLLAVGMLQWLARQYNLRFDWTQTDRHSLSAASIAAVKKLQGPITVTVFASKRGETRARIQTFVARYQRYQPDLELRFVDPDTAPDEARAAGVQREGDLFIEYGNAKERIFAPARLDEEAFTNGLTRLGHRGERWIVFLSGHGERSPERQANFDLSTWARELQKRGFQTRALALTEHPQIPANTSVFVIAGPRLRLLAGEVKAIQKYVDDGGNLLWLTDPGSMQGLEPVAEAFGIEFLPGVAVDPSSRDITGSATAIVVTDYGSHPVVREFTEATLFPQAGALRLNAPKGWNGAAMIDTRGSAWLETGALTGTIRFDPGRDLRGPLTLAVTLTREREKREQRVGVVADGDFLSNAFLANTGNLDLGLSLVNWLARDDDYVGIPVRAARDRRLELSAAARLTLVGVFLFGLPLAFVGAGVSQWWRRRKR